MFAHYDNAGVILAFTEDGVAPAGIPDTTIELTDEEYQDCATYGLLRRIDTAARTVVIYTPPPKAPADYAIDKLDELTTACRAHIVSGAVSNALGADYTYPTNNTAEHPDQQNLNGCVTESLLNDGDPNWTTKFWCMDSAGVWDRRIHTHAQIRAVGTAVAAHVRVAQDMLKQINDQVAAIVADAAMTDDEKRTAIDAVVW